MSIKIIEIESGFAVKFPFELKDNFRENFKSAKWNGEQKQWEVGKRSETKLNEWISLVSDVAKEIDAYKAEEEAASLNSENLRNITEEVERIRCHISKYRSEKKLFESSLEMLKAAKNELNIAKEKLEQEKIETADAAAKARKLLESVCDLNAICEAHSVLKQQHGKFKNGAGSKFKDAQLVIKKEHERLKEIGFLSRGLGNLYDCNHNRPDRDNPGDISYADYFDLIKLD